MKTYRYLIIIPGIIITLFVFMNSITSTPIKMEKKQAREFIKISSEKCLYYDQKGFNCPWDTTRVYQVLTRYTLDERSFAVVMDTLTESHRTIEEKFIVRKIK